MPEYLLGSKLYSEIVTYGYPISEITEISVRQNRPLTIKNRFSRKTGKTIVSQDDIKAILSRATKNSLYAYQDEIKMGYVSFDGIRIGLSGTVVMNGNCISTIKDITSLNIRIPHEVKGCAEPLKRLLDCAKGILIISPPLCGKTTYIRDLARISSQKYDTMLIDERGELFSPQYTFGQYIDIMSGGPKNIVAEGILRAMAPEVVVFDEIYLKRDLSALAELNSAGIKIIASAHIKNIDTLDSKTFNDIKEHFDYVVTLSNNPAVGSIKSIVKL